MTPLRNIYKIGSEGHFDGLCNETVPYAISCFLESQNFEDAIRKAVAAGGDTDTKAAICGSIAEAYYEIPEEMIEKAYLRICLTTCLISSRSSTTRYRVNSDINLCKEPICITYFTMQSE